MIKVYTGLPRRADHTISRFQEHWGTVHREHALGIDRIDRYVQSHRVPVVLAGTAQSPYDGFPEVWFPDLDTALSLAHDPQYLAGAHVDEPRFADVERIARTWTHPEVVRAWDGFARAEAPGKVLLLLATDTGHAPGLRVLAEATSALRIMCAAMVEDERVADRQAYGMAVELWWADEQAALDAWDVEHRTLLAGLAELADLGRSSIALVRERRVRWPGPYDPAWS